jgi:hypothetical protein
MCQFSEWSRRANTVNVCCGSPPDLVDRRGKAVSRHLLTRIASSFTLEA